ncbi:G-protein coupled receptor 151 [Conger conger]|uniref:G-protein coupled receptor 151 n=1 Tax=Conger conger TaxID=82655 RepID=UPI002A599A03|nr:G-protein coupled receptor 151 [Conger conger]
MDKFQSLNISVGNSSVDKQSFFDGDAYQNLDSQELRVLIPVILGIICVLGFTGNVTALGVLVTNARKGKLSLINSLILNLILADSLVLAFAVPFKAVSYSRASWTLGWFMCKASDWFLHSCMAAKSFIIAIMAKACLRYVSNPNKQVNIHYKTILVILLFSWALACVIPVPHWMFAALRREGEGLVCAQTEPRYARRFMSVYVKLYPLVAYCAPLSLALLLFWLAYSRCQRRGSKAQNLRTQMRSRKLTLMLFGLTVTTAIMWLPQWAGWVWAHHAAQNGGPAPPPLFSLSAELLMFSISLVNPLTVLSLSEEFREGYKGLWRRLTLRKQQPPKQGPHTPTVLRPPSPRAEPGGHGPATPRPDGEDPERPDGAAPDSPGNKDGVVLPDVEQFWSEREAGGPADETDPVPWEHQSPALRKRDA